MARRRRRRRPGGPTLIARLDQALAHIRRGRPTAGPSDVVIGEFGFARDYAVGGGCAAADAFRSIAAAVRVWGARHAIFWQILDNPSDPGTVWNNYGLVKYDLAESESWRALRQLVTGSPPGPRPTCPQINQGGIVDGLDWTHNISPGDVVSIFGTGFAATGNTVRIQANGRRYTIGAGTADWYESAGQINGRLPADMSGTILVYVRHGTTGRDSNGAPIGLVAP